MYFCLLKSRKAKVAILNKKLKNSQLERLDIKAYKQKQKLPVVIVLDNVRSMHNVGAVFRTIDGFSFQAIYLCGITAKPPHREIQKTALGATKSVEWKYYSETHQAISELQQEGYEIIAIEQAAQKVWLNEFDVQPQKKYALVFGHEVKGVSQGVINKADCVIEIPQQGTKHSFNISVSVGIVGWAFFSSLNKAK